MPRPEITEVIHGFGHENVQATHYVTLEFTKDANLSKNGDCVVVVAADKGLADLGANFKNALRKINAMLTVKIEADNVSEEIHAQGSPNLSLTHPNEMVLRKSDFVSDRTLGIYSDKAAKDISRELVEKLRNPMQSVRVTLTVWV